MEEGTVDPESLESLFNDAIKATDVLHRDFSNAAQVLGHTRDSFEKAKPAFLELARLPETGAVTNVLVTGADFVSSYRDQLVGLRAQTSTPLNQLRAVAGTVDAFMATTSTATHVLNVVTVMVYEPNPFLVRDDEASFADRLAKLDPVLGRTYQQVLEALHTTRADPERAALFLMRQSLDHLFDCLAPDDEVRASQYWTPKQEGKRNQVHRTERIEYAAFTRINDPNRAKTLADSARYGNETYNLLNYAHKRGELDRDKARNALTAAQRMLEDWADALDL